MSSIEHSETTTAARPSTVKAIIEAAGGPAKIVEASAGAVQLNAVYKWPKIGIRDSHWDLIMGLCDVTTDELHAANKAARAAAEQG